MEEEQPLDLEGALTVNTITAITTNSFEERMPIVAQQIVKKPKKSPPKVLKTVNILKRGRQSISYEDLCPKVKITEIEPETVVVEKPDANLSLKVRYFFI